MVIDREVAEMLHRMTPAQPAASRVECRKIRRQSTTVTPWAVKECPAVMRVGVPERIEVVDERVAEILRGLTPAQRLKIVFQLNRRLRVAIEGHVRSCHLEWTEEQVRRETRWRMHGGTR